MQLNHESHRCRDTSGGGASSLHEYTGDFVTAAGYTARFRVIDSRLCLQLTDRTFIPLQPTGAAEFGVPFCVDFGVRFDRGDDVDGGTLIMGNQARQFRRAASAR